MASCIGGNEKAACADFIHALSAKNVFFNETSEVEPYRSTPEEARHVWTYQV